MLRVRMKFKYCACPKWNKPKRDVAYKCRDCKGYVVNLKNQKS